MNTTENQAVNSFSILDEREERVLLPLVVKILGHRGSKEKVFSNAKIRNVLREFGEDVSDLQIRKLVFYIRKHAIIELLIANGEGYYVAEHIDDINSWIARQTSKIQSMRETLEAIMVQYEENKSKIHTGGSKLIGQLSMFDGDI